MTPTPAPPQGPAAPAPEPGRPALAGGGLVRLWQTEVPKVVQRHEAERLQVRQALGLVL